MAKLDAQRELLEIVKRWATVESRRAALESTPEGAWIDARNTVNNPIIDAERILVLLFTLNEIPNPKLHIRVQQDGDNAQKYFHGEMAESIKPLLNRREGAKLTHAQVIVSILDVVEKYFQRHTTNQEDDRSAVRHLFGAEGYLSEGKLKGDVHKGLSSKDVHVTDAYSFSVTLCLNVMRMIAKLRIDAMGKSELPTDKLDGVFEKASARLTASMLGLLASFSLPIGRVSDDALKAEEYKRRTRREWSEAIRKALEARVCRKLKPFGVELVPHSQTFEIGWTWGALHPTDILRRGGREKDGNRILLDDSVHEAASEIASQTDVHAENAPYFYFTVSALDAIVDLTSPDVQSLELLSASQAEYAARLANLADITREYWKIIALGEQTDWPMANIPWSPSDTNANNPQEQSSALWNLYLLRIVLSDASEFSDPRSLARLIELLSELADVGRITRDPFPIANDPMVRTLHWPGYAINLLGTANDKARRPVEGMQWIVYDYAPQLLKVCGVVLQMAIETDRRDELIELTTKIWNHLEKRKDQVGDADKETRFGSWDNVAGAFKEHSSKFEEVSSPLKAEGGVTEGRVGSWYFTERVVEGLVAVASAQTKRPPAHPELGPLCLSLCAGLEHAINTLVAEKELGDKLQHAVSELEQAREDVSGDVFLAFARISFAGSEFLRVRKEHKPDKF